jgi:dienelactone hydrolase
MACDNCKTGFKWEGTSVGKETKFNGVDAYVTGDNKDAAILIVTDIFGWTLPNIRLIADHYAKEACATVYVPDLYAFRYSYTTEQQPLELKNVLLMRLQF